MNWVYLLLFPLLYWLEFREPGLVPFVIVVILVWSYFKILYLDESEPILFLILFSRSLNGFMIPGSDLSWSVLNFLTGYFPIILFLVKNLFIETKLVWDAYSKGLVAYGVLLFFYGLLDIDSGYNGYRFRLLPIIFLAIIQLVRRENFNIQRISVFLRMCSIGFIFVYFDPIYLITRPAMVLEPHVFREALVAIPSEDLLRNWGAFWDARILGTYGFTHLLLALVLKWKHWRTDVFLAICVVASSMSRGALVVAGIIIMVAVFEGLRKKIKNSAISLFACVAAVMVLVLGVRVLIPDFVLEILGVSGERPDPISQRSDFIRFAWDKFLENPFGRGLYVLKSINPDEPIDFGGRILYKASDAYWAISLAEIGVFGTALFVRAIYKLIYFKNWIIVGFLFGISIQLIGTDVPDMGGFFFAFVMLWGLPRQLNKSHNLDDNT